MIVEASQTKHYLSSTTERGFPRNEKLKDGDETEKREDRTSSCLQLARAFKFEKQGVHLAREPGRNLIFFRLARKEVP